LPTTTAAATATATTITTHHPSLTTTTTALIATRLDGDDAKPISLQSSNLIVLSSIDGVHDHPAVTKSSQQPHANDGTQRAPQQHRDTNQDRFKIEMLQMHISLISDSIAEGREELV
jgi:hypothetical protein